MRKLALKRETLTALDPDDLVRVNGAAPSVFCTSALTFCDAVCEATADLSLRCTPATI